MSLLLIDIYLCSSMCYRIPLPPELDREPSESEHMWFGFLLLPSVFPKTKQFSPLKCKIIFVTTMENKGFFSIRNHHKCLA